MLLGFGIKDTVEEYLKSQSEWQLPRGFWSRYLLFGAWKKVNSAYLQMKEGKEQNSDTQIIMNDQELV